MFIQSDFKAAWWLSNKHLQTISAKLFRTKQKINALVETLELPDGDFIDLAWSQSPEKISHQPIVVILHGLEGSIDSHYIQGLMHACATKGWVAVLMHFRGCSGRPNRQAASYHSGDTRDITFLADVLKNRYQTSSLFLVGFSLGGNVVARYLAEQQETPFTSATVICAPLKLAQCSDSINKGFAKVYQKYLLDMLKNGVKQKISQGVITHITSTAVDEIKTMRAFDHLLTAPLNGFSSADDYYQQASGITKLHTINLPCLVIHAADDPFLADKNMNLPNTLPDNITFEVSSKGGHMGFISGNNPLKPNYWLEQRIPNFIEQHL